jgi:plastocyanin
MRILGLPSALFNVYLDLIAVGEIRRAMKKALPIIIIVIVIVAAGGTYIALKNNNNSSNTMSNMNTQKDTTASSQPVATDKVTIANFAFSPADITVKMGTAVTWTNTDSVDHTVTETDGKTGPQSQDLAKGQSYSFTYNAVGTYKYHCSVHPDMIGVVTVTN